MVSTCGNCGKSLQLNEAQRQKIEQALAALPAGKSLKFNCPYCQKPIEVRRDDQVEAHKAPSPTSRAKNLFGPPAPPDLGWLQQGERSFGESVEEIPRALLLVDDKAMAGDLARFFEEMGYQAVLPASVEDALEQMRFGNVAVVVQHASYEGGLQGSTVHAHMRSMSMAERRAIIYVLVGPEFHTLYNLEALCNSANLLVNDNELSSFPVLFKRGLRDYEELFGPYLAALETHGKK